MEVLLQHAISSLSASIGLKEELSPWAVPNTFRNSCQKLKVNWMPRSEIMRSGAPSLPQQKHAIKLHWGLEFFEGDEPPLPPFCAPHLSGLGYLWLFLRVFMEFS